MILRENGEVVVALMAINRETWLLGDNPDARSWSVVDKWEKAELEHDRFYERLYEW